MENILNTLGLSTRAWFRLLRVARTIADMSESQDILREHILEALSYRAIDRMLVHLQKMLA